MFEIFLGWAEDSQVMRRVLLRLSSNQSVELSATPLCVHVLHD